MNELKFKLVFFGTFIIGVLAGYWIAEIQNRRSRRLYEQILEELKKAES